LSRKSATSLHLEPAPSRSLALAVASIHFLAAIACTANSLPVWARTVLLCLVLASGWATYRRYCRDLPVRRIDADSDGEWRLSLRDGRQRSGCLQGSSIVSVWMTVLHIRTDAGICTVLLCRDSLDEESYRLLRVFLKVCKH
jgi:hypothetical protein